MPNWCFNGLTIEGNPESVKKLMTQMNKPFKSKHDSWNPANHQMEIKESLYPNPVFAFHNIYNHIEAGIPEDVYMGQPDRSLSLQEQMKFKTNDWYSFNVREWGTKWDVAVAPDDTYPDTNMEETANGDNHVVHYNFNTAWSPPMPAVSKLSAQYPDLLFTLSYEEETGWGGECEFLRGEKISESEFETLCRECDETDCLIFDEEKGVEICQKCGYES